MTIPKVFVRWRDDGSVLPFRHPKPIIGMVHLEPLPGALRSGPPMQEVAARAVADARALEQGGADAVLVENYGDAPFAERLGPEAVAGLALAVQAVEGAVRVPVGVNALRNDAPAAVAIAHLAGARFVRCNVWSGVAWTDQGTIEGCARATLELRKRLGAQVALLADALVKHASHPGTLAQAIVDNERNLCDAHVVSGTHTGSAAVPEGLAEAKRVGRLPVLVGSGTTPENLARYAAADGFIVGTSLKGSDGRVDPKRVEALVRARDAVR